MWDWLFTLTSRKPLLKMQTYTQNGDDSLRYKNKRIVIWKDKKKYGQSKGKVGWRQEKYLVTNCTLGLIFIIVPRRKRFILMEACISKKKKMRIW